jgi:hypothetical protein
MQGSEKNLEGGIRREKAGPWVETKKSGLKIAEILGRWPY